MLSGREGEPAPSLKRRLPGELGADLCLLYLPKIRLGVCVDLRLVKRALETPQSWDALGLSSSPGVPENFQVLRGAIQGPLRSGPVGPYSKKVNSSSYPCVCVFLSTPSQV